MSMIDLFLKSVGFDPVEFEQATRYYKAEFEGMKSGLQQAVQHFNTQLETVKATQERIEHKLDAITIAFQYLKPSTELKPNGHDHERSSDIRHG